jgi:hypothetical protein
MKSPVKIEMLKLQVRNGRVSTCTASGSSEKGCPGEGFLKED